MPTIFTMGCDDLIVVTDHKPLVKIFSDRALDEISNTRILKLKQRTLKWRFKPIQVPGKSIPAPDATSRNPAFRSKSNGIDDEKEAKYDEASAITDEMAILIVASIKSNYQKIQAVTLERVRSATKEEPYMRILSDTIINGFPNEASCLPPQLQPYWQHQGNLSIVDEVIIFKDKIIVPPSLPPEICITLHSAHQDI